MTVEEVVLELDGSDNEDSESSGSEDDFEGYLNEDSDEEEDDHGSDDDSSSEGTGSDEDMQVEVPSVPSYTLQVGVSATLSGTRPLDYFSLFMDDSMLQHIVAHTNLCAQQYMESHTLAPHSRKRQWQKEEHTLEELQRFLALILVMGLVHYPRVESHWNTSWPYATDTFSSVSFMHCESTYMHISIHTHAYKYAHMHISIHIHAYCIRIHVHCIHIHVFSTGVEERPLFPTYEVPPFE